MKTKYDIGDKILMPCKVKAIAINKNGICYQVIPEGYTSTTLEVTENEIHSSMCNEEVKEGE